DGQPGLAASALAAQPPAIRTRLLRAAALTAGAPAGALSLRPVTELDALVTGWRGQRGVDLPGGIRCRRRYGRLLFGPVAEGTAVSDAAAEDDAVADEAAADDLA